MYSAWDPRSEAAAAGDDGEGDLRSLLSVLDTPRRPQPGGAGRVNALSGLPSAARQLSRRVSLHEPVGDRFVRDARLETEASVAIEAAFGVRLHARKALAPLSSEQ